MKRSHELSAGDNLNLDSRDEILPAEIRDLPGHGAAVFDADGVLWHGDISEDFVRWRIDRGEFPEPLWREYAQVHARDPAEAARHILGFYRGHPAAEIEQSVAQFYAEAPARRWIPRTIAALSRRGSPVFVVSASPAPVLKPLADLLPVAGIFGIEMELDSGGHYTGGTVGTVTTGAGKAQRFREACALEVELAVGDSALDVHLLELSSGVSWAINPDPTLEREAAARGWLVTREQDPLR